MPVENLARWTGVTEPVDAAGLSPEAVTLMKRRMQELTPKLRAYAVGLLGSVHDADDLVQETLMRAWRFRATYRVDTNFKAWLFRILRNNFLNNVSQPRCIQDVDGVFTGQLAEPPMQEWPLRYAEVLRALQKLRPDQRDCLVLLASGATYDEVASISECSIGTVKSRISRARRRLLEILEWEGLPRHEPRLMTGGREAWYG
jgi:RNA polymerase sigma-70 factor (ECF subfamily)